MHNDLKKTILVGAILVAGFAICGALFNQVMIDVLSRVVIMALYALSFNLMFGYTGMSSIGHALYFGFGGYALMIILTKTSIPLVPAVVLAILAVIPVAWFLGTACLKNNMLTFSFLTMGLCTTVQLVIYKTTAIGGTVGITHYFLPEWLSDYRVLYFFILGCVVVCSILIYLLCQSPYVQMLKGVRENDERLTFLGVNVRRMRVSVFVISAVFASIAGILYAFRNSGVYTTSLDGAVSNQAIMMCIIGGRSSFIGPIIGSIIITPIQNYLSVVTKYYESVIGVIILLTAYFMRNGILSPTGIVIKGVRKVEAKLFPEQSKRKQALSKIGNNK